MRDRAAETSILDGSENVCIDVKRSYSVDVPCAGLAGRSSWPHFFFVCVVQIYRVDYSC